MSQVKPCVFVTGRSCPFKIANVPFQTCQLCIEAWKTEVSLKGQQPIQVQNTPPPVPQQPQPVAIPVDTVERPVFYDEGLMEIDELLKNESIDPLDYVKLRKLQLDRMVNQKNKGKLILSLDLKEPGNVIRPVPKQYSPAPIEIKPVPVEYRSDIIEAEPVPVEIKQVQKEVKVAVVVKTMFGKQIYTSPKGWKLPKAINNKVIKSIFKLASRKKAGDIRLRAGNFKIACVSRMKGKYAIMVIDANEDFEAYEGEIERVSNLLSEAKFWATAVNQIN
ncbi:hypothetical protein HOC87_11875 [Candidatus Bathyarchaeota archaeon]|nr:hypothetical protein [Candidatus Bathyarchaeota archaeon]MBT5642244.1 hypothetical protein [Candidatus Bathyarchaeota archaeon]